MTDNQFANAEAAYVQVALPLPVRKLFTYRLRPELASAVKPGARVLVPFGRRSLTGYAVEISPNPELSPDTPLDAIKDVAELLDDEPLFTPEILSLTKWAADYYAASWGEMLKAALPAGINAAVEQIVGITEKGRREARDAAAKRGVKWKLLHYLSLEGETAFTTLKREFGERTRAAIRELAAAELVHTRAQTGVATAKPKRQKVVKLLASDPELKKTSAQSAVLQTLEAAGGEALFTQVLESAGVSASAINTLAKKGVVSVAIEEILRDPLGGDAGFDREELRLNAEQAFVLNEITNAVRRDEYKGLLLHGVTGSGKTEIYIRAMQQALALGKTSLMLVPEIALTPIFARRLRGAFGSTVAILHSNLSAGERFDEWRRIRAGTARIVIGTRSAIFAPLQDIGLVVIDEEHDTSYRQNESPFYHARDLAVMRASFAKGVVVLGSATPSLESFYNAKAGKYEYLQLQKRIGGRPMAVAELIDMREVFKRAGKDVVVSPHLTNLIGETHARGEQSMILLNRRGFSSFVLCRSCGESLRCKNCDITLTYHRRDDRVTCHYCGFNAATPKVCPFCKSEYLYFIGQGTEQLESILRKLLPELRIARVDRDTMKKRGEMDRTLLAFDRGEIDMLVGTQMLAKGHDFHNVTLVGVISVDTGLGLPDFRAAERTFQLLTQVAGRAGRGELPGRVLIQTYYPEHYALKYAVEQDFEKFYDHEMRFRTAMSYPPIVSLGMIMVKHTDLDKARRNADILRAALDAANTNKECRILGPAVASLSRLKNEHRLQIIIRSASRHSLRSTIDEALKRAEVAGGDLRNYTVEIDPVNLM